MKQLKYYFIFLLLLIGLTTVSAQEKALPKKQLALPLLKISANNRYFESADGKPFFWLGDTGWLLFIKLNRQEVIQYLDNRKQKGYNVIQVMVLHDVKKVVNRYGDSALKNLDAAHPKTTPGTNFSNNTEYDFWDHVDFVINEALKRGIYMALVPVWGSNVKEGLVNETSGKAFAEFLAKRYRNQPNIIWLNGGDILGDTKTPVWESIGTTLRKEDPNHLITFHPRGRSSSSQWFHNAAWLDFNMFQSGHKDYAQDTVEPRMGEDNWKFMQKDYQLIPTKPSMDGEPSYENIPHGLHDTLGPKWHAADVRRYGYWNVFAGGAGFTYGSNAVMQFHSAAGSGDYGTHQNWKDAINDTGAGQMQWIKKLILSMPYFERVPDQSLIASDQGEKYQHLLATRGKQFAFIYTYTGRTMNIQMGKIAGTKLTASWFDPRNGNYTTIGVFENKGTHVFNPPGEEKEGNDWILVLKSAPTK